MPSALPVCRALRMELSAPDVEAPLAAAAALADRAWAAIRTLLEVPA
ncbi:MAG: hypothetical protein ACP5VP_06210 [Candidatus Limnocylindrales bacterium]